MFTKLLLSIILVFSCQALHAGPLDWIAAKYAQARVATYRYFYPRWTQQQMALSQLESFLTKNILDIESAGKIFHTRYYSLENPSHRGKDLDTIQKQIKEWISITTNARKAIIAINEQLQEINTAQALFNGMPFDQSEIEFKEELEDRKYLQENQLRQANLQLQYLYRDKHEMEAIENQRNEVKKQQEKYLNKKIQMFQQELSLPEYQEIWGFLK